MKKEKIGDRIEDRIYLVQRTVRFHVGLENELWKSWKIVESRVRQQIAYRVMGEVFDEISK